MNQKYRPITRSERVTQIGVGLFTTLVLASGIGFLAPWIFQWVANIMDPTPAAMRDCQIKDYLDKPLADLQRCWAESESYQARAKKLGHTIPWFWLFFISFGAAILRNPVMGRIRDDSDDITYDGQDAWEFFLHIIIQILFVIAIWTFFIRDKSAFIALVLSLSAVLLWYAIHIYLLKRFGTTKSKQRDAAK